MLIQETLTYSDSGKSFEGFVAYENDGSADKPIVLVVHAYKGLLQFEKDKAVELARMGYVGFAVDLYGKGRRGSNVEEGRALMKELNDDREVLLDRMQLALEEAMKLDVGNSDQIAAIGFCFGGKCCLDLARSGTEINGISVFHGVFDKPASMDTQQIKTKVLILHGYDDPLAKPEEMIELCDELTQANAQWEICAYGHTGHAFTNPEAKNHDGGLFYSQLASDRSWNRMNTFFNEIFDRS